MNVAVVILLYSFFPRLREFMASDVVEIDGGVLEGVCFTSGDVVLYSTNIQQTHYEMSTSS